MMPAGARIIRPSLQGIRHPPLAARSVWSASWTGELATGSSLQ